jgi:hypothetical protein
MSLLRLEPQSALAIEDGRWDALTRRIQSAGKGLPRRDLWLLPLIVVLTVLTLSLAAEVGARIGWPEQKRNSCAIPDPALGYRFKPNCTSVMKAAEGPWFTNSYNGCGYRSPQSCGPVAPGTRRIALIGSSMSEGYLVPYPDTIGARLAQDLTVQCRAPVEVQNLGGLGYFASDKLLRRFDEALALHPNAVLLVVTPFDLQTGIEEDDPAQKQKAAAVSPLGTRARLFNALKESRAFVVAQHFHFQDMAVYLPLYLSYGDKADFLRSPFTAPWQVRLRRLDAAVSEMSRRAHDAGASLVLAFVPQEAELALMARGHLPPGVDPAALPRAVAAIAARHGVNFVDTSAALKAQPQPEKLYYQVDGHLSGAGQPLAAAPIATLFGSQISPSCATGHAGAPS